jgi:hypothetical protein
MKTKQMQLTMVVTVTVPEQAEIVGARAFRLPSGDIVKVFSVLELNDERDMTWSEANSKGLDYEDEVIIDLEEGVA